MSNLDILREMENLRKDFDWAFNNLKNGSHLSPKHHSGIGTSDFPRMNLREDDDNFYLEAMVPGVNYQDLNLSIMQNTLSFSGEYRENYSDESIRHRHERGVGKFMRSIELPSKVNTEEVDAQYHNGMLLLTIPKAEDAKAKKITIHPH